MIMFQENGWAYGFQIGPAWLYWPHLKDWRAGSRPLCGWDREWRAGRG